MEKAPLESYADVGGLEPQIQEIKEAVELPLTHPELYEDIGIKPPKVWRTGGAGRHQGRRATRGPSGRQLCRLAHMVCAMRLMEAMKGSITLINSSSSENKQSPAVQGMLLYLSPQHPHEHDLIMYCPMCRV